MNSAVEKKAYEKLPLIYSHLMRKVDYSVWAKYIYSLVKDTMDEDSTALELGAGNCSFADYFYCYFPKLIATDISKYMLSSGTSDFFPKVCCDMARLPFKKKFDIIYCNFDTVNYLTSKKKLLEMFRQVKKILNDNGIFTFDASMERNSLVHTKQPERSGLYKGIKFKQKSEYDSKSKIHKNSFLIKLKNGEIFSETHRQRIFPFETYFELLDTAGLYASNCYEAFSYKQGKPNSVRVQFITKKIKKNVNL